MSLHNNTFQYDSGIATTPTRHAYTPTYERVHILEHTRTHGVQGTNHSSNTGIRNILTWVNPRHELFKSIKPLGGDKEVAIKTERAVVLLHRFLVLVRRYVRVRQCCMQVLVTLLLQPFLQSCVCHRCEHRGGGMDCKQTARNTCQRATESGRQRRDTITSNRTECRQIEREKLRH
jgi:hypothetical protein